MHLGLAIAEKCKLSDELEAILRYHRYPEDARATHRPLVPLVALALATAHHIEHLRAERSGIFDSEDVPAAHVPDRAGRFDATQQMAEEEDLDIDALTYAIAEVSEKAQGFARQILDGSSS